MLDKTLLLQVEKPAQYVGAEHNIIRKDPSTVALRMVMCYPDLYEVGMCHVGLHILHHIANLRDDVFCERAFHPQPDATAMLRTSGLPLTSLETGTPLREFDVIGVTLQHELTYTSVLSVLDLGGVPLLSADRRGADPIVIAGGPCAYHPEPLAPFVDAFVIGDGEEALGEVLEALSGLRGNREAALDALGGLSGVYLPARHDPDDARIVRRVVPDLDRAAFPTAPIVPWVEVVHDRAQIEVARGCTRGCRFCQAGYVYRPVRERATDTLRVQAREIIANTGYDEVSLVSLNCPDYTGIGALVDGLQADLWEQRISIGLPSLRVDTFSVGLAQKVHQVRKSGITFAPEAGSQRLRDVINKGVTEQDLYESVSAAFDSGWNTIKLYFMIGLPTETDEDVLAIGELAENVLRIGSEVAGKARRSRLKLNVSVSNLVPKPHTPFQWDGQIAIDEMLRRQQLVRGGVRERRIHLSCHDARQSAVEAALARGGREAAQAVLEAYRMGGILDAWRERFDFARWTEAFRRVGLDLQEQAQRSFAYGEPLPWRHIDCGVSDAFLWAERTRGAEGALTGDCRTAGCHGCGISALASCPLVTCGTGAVVGRAFQPGGAMGDGEAPRD